MDTFARGTPASHGGFRDARESQRLTLYLRDVWSRKEYCWYVASSELRTRQINSLLGNLWHLINPALQIGVYFIIFGLVLKVDRGVDNFLGFLTVGVFTYQLTQKTVTSAARSLTRYRGLIRMVRFPRAILPITATLTELMAIVPAVAVMFGVLIITGETPSVTWVLICPMLVLQSFFNAGLAMAVARAAERVPDIQQLLPFVFRLGFYASGVLFSAAEFLDGSGWWWLFKLNPLYGFIAVNRSIAFGTSFDSQVFIGLVVWSFTVLAWGLAFFRSAEDRYGAS